MNWPGSYRRQRSQLKQFGRRGADFEEGSVFGRRIEAARSPSQLPAGVDIRRLNSAGNPISICHLVAVAKLKRTYKNTDPSGRSYKNENLSLNRIWRRRNSKSPDGGLPLVIFSRFLQASGVLDQFNQGHCLFSPCGRVYSGIGRGQPGALSQDRMEKRKKKTSQTGKIRA